MIFIVFNTIILIITVFLSTYELDKSINIDVRSPPKMQDSWSACFYSNIERKKVYFSARSV